MAIGRFYRYRHGHAWSGLKGHIREQNRKLAVPYSSFSNIGAMQPLRGGNQQEMRFEDESGKRKRKRKRLRERTAS